MAVQAIGFVAGSLTAVAFLPQVVKTWRTRSAADLSAGMLAAQSAGVALWIAYGIAMDLPPVIAANAITLALTAVLIAMKRRF